MTFKLDPKKYEGHTEGPWRFEYQDEKYPCYVQRGMDGGFVIEGRNKMADGKLIADGPDILAHAVKLEAEKAELIEVIMEILELDNNEEQDVVKGEIYSRAFDLVNKAKGGE